MRRPSGEATERRGEGGHDGIRRALVASDSPVAKDPRVLRQIRWLVADGFTVDTLGRGAGPAEANGTHFEMRDQHRILRIIANVLLPHPIRNRVIVESTIPRSVRQGSVGYQYEATIINEVELLPWFTRRGYRRIAYGSGAQRHLDLHEFAPGQGYGLQARLLYRRYRLWLSRFAASTVFTSRSTVSPGIGRLYKKFLAVPTPAIVKSCPDFVDVIPSEVDPDAIRLVHHGTAASVRGLHLMIDAMADIDERFSLHLMLVGSVERVDHFKTLAERFGKRISFIDPVPVSAVADRLNEFDLEIIFFPPVTANLRHTLPNKLFEAIQGRLGLVVGPSPDMVDLVESAGNAAIVDGWSAMDLARTINALTTEDVARLKAHSHDAAHQFSAESEGRNFMSALGARDHRGHGQR